MNDAPAAFQATVHGFRTVPSRKVVQITIEAPIELHATIAMIAEHGAWVGVARLQPPSEAPVTPPEPALTEAIKERTPFNELPATTQAVLRCKDGPFQRYVIEEKRFNELPDDPEKNAACYVRKVCNVNSRSSLSTSKPAGRLWFEIDTEFLSWKLRERVLA